MDVESLLTKAQESLHAGRSFGPVIERDGCVVVPVAVSAGGGGGGGGTGPDGVNSGDGAGYGGVSWPLGVYVIKDGTAKWVPALDMTRVILAGVGIVKLILRLRSRRRT